MDVRAGPKRRLSTEELIFLNCGAGVHSESPLDSKEIKPVSSKGNQSWLFIGMTDAEAEAPILQPADAKSQLTGKDSDAGKDWRKNEKGQQKMRWLDSITDSKDMHLSKVRDIVENRGTWCATVHGDAGLDAT